MPRSDIAMPAPNLLFDLSNFLREELYRSAALCADHVMMTAPVVLMLVAGDAIMKGDLAGQPAACQQLQRPIDGGKTNARIGLLDQPMQLIDREVFASFEEGPQDGVALPGLLEADALEVAEEDLLGLADVLLRDGRLIVDSFLQHGGRRPE